MKKLIVLPGALVIVAGLILIKDSNLREGAIIAGLFLMIGLPIVRRMGQRSEPEVMLPGRNSNYQGPGYWHWERQLLYNKLETAIQKYALQDSWIKVAEKCQTFLIYNQTTDPFWYDVEKAVTARWFKRKKIKRVLSNLEQ